nr:BAHD acyltransferase [Heliotropium arborescens]
MASSRLQLISKKVVKPSIPTSPSLRNYKLSLMDHQMVGIYMPMAFFYPNLHHHKHPHSRNEVSSHLENSLSKTLASYYPFAGRIAKNSSINCNDMGATLLECHVKGSMSEFLEENNMNATSQADLFPSGLPFSSGHNDSSLVVAQLSHFDCGGKALSLCMNHKVGDAHTLFNFMNHWASVARQSNETLPPQFIGFSIMPSNDDPSTESILGPKQMKQGITRRYVFDAQTLSQLKAKASAESGVQNPTRVEVVTALLCKHVITANMVCSGSFKPSVLATAVNFRSQIGPPVTQTSVGNFVSFALVLISDERELNFSKLVGEIRKAKLQQYGKYKGIKQNELVSTTLEIAEQIKSFHGNDDIDTYGFSSLCRYPTNQIDFGWGKPIRINLAANPFKNICSLLDNHNGDGIDVFIPLEEHVMSVLQRDPDLMAFAFPGSGFGELKVA